MVSALAADATQFLPGDLACLWTGERPRDFRAWLVRDRVMSVADIMRYHQEAAKSGRPGMTRMMLHRGLALLLAVASVTALTGGHKFGFGAGSVASAATINQDGGDDLNGDGIAPMPFERPGDSFPGSAFYYLSAEAAGEQPANQDAPLDVGAHWDNEAPPANGLVLPNPGPAARPLGQASSFIDRERALSCLTAAIYYEAASEPDPGQRAVAQVVLNRVAHPSYPNTVCGVVYQGSERTTGCQFSFTCDGALARRPSQMFWKRAQAVARDALAGYVYAPVGLATHYHTFAVHPYWADSLNFIGQIGAHRFYRMHGPAGALATFRFGYAGGEPLPAPHTRNAAADKSRDTAPDPLAVERAYLANVKTTPVGQLGTRATSFAAPSYTSDEMRRGGDAAHRASNLPITTNVRPEYQGSGAWIAQPQ